MLSPAILCPIIAAGLMNGSFVIPARYIKNIPSEKIWFYYSLIGLGIIPWLIMAAIFPTIISQYSSIPTGILGFIFLGGIVFGLGQLCFAYTIESIGIALSYTINLAIGVTIGSLFVTFYQTPITTQSYTVVFAVFLIISSLIMYYLAGKKDPVISDKSNYHKGWIFASLAGLASGFQNITFFIVAFHTQTQFQSINSFWVWPPFLLASALTMLIGFYYRSNYSGVLSKTFIKKSDKPFITLKNILLIILMGILFTGSLGLYSVAMNQLSHSQKSIGWPAFMISIILTSQMWGYLYKELNQEKTKNKFLLFLSILLLIIAIIILAIKA